MKEHPVPMSTVTSINRNVSIHGLRSKKHTLMVIFSPALRLKSCPAGPRSSILSAAPPASASECLQRHRMDTSMWRRNEVLTSLVSSAMWLIEWPLKNRAAAKRHKESRLWKYSLGPILQCHVKIKRVTAAVEADANERVLPCRQYHGSISINYD